MNRGFEIIGVLITIAIIAVIGVGILYIFTTNPPTENYPTSFPDIEQIEQELEELEKRNETSTE
jgi:hypothetical protein